MISKRESFEAFVVLALLGVSIAAAIYMPSALRWDGGLESYNESVKTGTTRSDMDAYEDAYVASVARLAFQAGVNTGLKVTRKIDANEFETGWTNGMFQVQAYLNEEESKVIDKIIHIRTNNKTQKKD